MRIYKKHMKARSNSALISIPVEWVREHGLEEDPWVELFVDREILVRPLRREETKTAQARGERSREGPARPSEPVSLRKRPRSSEGACA